MMLPCLVSSAKRAAHEIVAPDDFPSSPKHHPWVFYLTGFTYRQQRPILRSLSSYLFLESTPSAVSSRKAGQDKRKGGMLSAAKHLVCLTRDPSLRRITKWPPPSAHTFSDWGSSQRRALALPWRFCRSRLFTKDLGMIVEFFRDGTTLNGRAGTFCPFHNR